MSTMAAMAIASMNSSTIISMLLMTAASIGGP
jgi:hypothetical protein